jgi:hypothetical protein
LANICYGHLVKIAASDSSSAIKADANYVCTGVWDDNTIQAVVRGASANDNIWLRGGHFSIGKRINLVSDINFYGDGNSTELKVIDKVQSALAADCNSDDAIIYVVDSTGFRAGQQVTILDDANTDYQKGNESTISTVNGNTIVLTGGGSIVDSYYPNPVVKFKTASNARVFTTFSCMGAFSKARLKVHDFKINGNLANQTQGTYDNFQNGLQFVGCNKPSNIYNLYVANIPYHGILLYDIYYPTNPIIDINCYSNTIVSCKGGIHGHGASDCNISYNNIYNCQTGIYAFYGTGINCNHNYIKNSTQNGFYFIGTANSNFNYNTIKDTNGIYSAGFCTTSTFTGNTIGHNLFDTITREANSTSSCGSGLYLSVNSGHNIVADNNFVGVYGNNIYNVGSYTDFQRNTIHLTSAASEGIYCYGANHLTLTDNVITSTQNCCLLDFEGGSYYTISGDKYTETLDSGSTKNIHIDGGIATISDINITSANQGSVVYILGAGSTLKNSAIRATTATPNSDPTVVADGADDIVTCNKITSPHTATTDILKADGAGTVNVGNRLNNNTAVYLVAHLTFDDNSLDSLVLDSNCGCNSVYHGKDTLTEAAAVWNYYTTNQNKDYRITLKTKGAIGNTFTCATSNNSSYTAANGYPKFTLIDGNTITILMKTGLPTFSANDVMVKWNSDSNVSNIGDFNCFNSASTSKIAGQPKKYFTGGADDGSEVNTTTHRRTVAGYKAGERALSFNGTTDYVDTEQTFQSTFRNSFTVSAWMKFANINGTLCEIGTQDYSTLRIRTSNIDGIDGEAEITYQNPSGSAGAATTSAITTLNTWTLITTVFEQTTPTTVTVYLYVNGKLIKRGQTTDCIMSAWSSNLNLLIGGSIDLFGTKVPAFSGSLEDIRIYNKTLTQEEIAAIYNDAGLPDNNAPTPNPLVWAIEPNAISSGSIIMTAATAADISGVEYYFANITDPNHDSNWVAAPVWTDTGLANNTKYTYMVIARDKSSNRNETGWSDAADAATLRFDCVSPIASDIDGDCQVNLSDFVRLARDWAGNPPPVDLNHDGKLDFEDLAQFAIDWLTCNRNPAEECWQ